MSPDNTIRVAAVIIRDERGRVLTDRKGGTTHFMSVGGKREPHETYRQAAVRECHEELGVHLDPAKLKLYGIFTAPAANEEGFQCEQTLFEYTDPLPTEPQASREIEELRWIDLEQALPDEMAPLFTRFVPTLSARRSIRAVTCYMGAASGNMPIFEQGVRAFAEELALRGVDLVYGGGKVGLMGSLADAALAAGGDVIGVIPQALVDAELAHPDISRLEVVPDMAARKDRLGALGDAIIALPGGSGTM
jgi:8-oxo-dGTP pyrophosphatase MutT (NUDIX family)